MYKDLFWLEFSKELSSLRNRERQKLPYNFNLIDELHADENAHTRILLKLLSYHAEGNYTFLCSFLSMLSRRNRIFSSVCDKIVAPKIDFNKEYIDGLIEETSKDYAIIIENKIRGAVDQYKQIERYFYRVKQHGVKEDNIYVIYLTLDGSKKISSDSLPEWLRNELEDRFIEINYKDDILPWLKKGILPEIKRKDYLLESGVEQYIDYIEGSLNLRESEKPIHKQMSDIINEKLGLNGKGIKERWNFLKECVTDLDSLRNDLIVMKDSEFENVKNSWDTITKERFGDDVYAGFRDNYYQIFLDNIDRSIHFEWCGVADKELFNANSYRMVLHVENDDTGNRNLTKLSRNDILRKVAEELHYETPFSGSTKTADAICKEYTSGKSFAELNDNERRSFLYKAYDEVCTLKRIIEETFHKLDEETMCIMDLCETMENHTNHAWRIWPDNKDLAWDVVTSFNRSTNEIGIEGVFAVNNNKQVVFRCAITVWKAACWGVYNDEILKRYSNLEDQKEEKDGRVSLYLPDILIGDSLADWNTRKAEIVKKIQELFSFMNEMTMRIGK